MKVTDKVESILKYSTKARNSDRELLIEFMQGEDMNLTPKQIEVFRHMPSLETVRRIRQKLQENGQYPADLKIKKERNFKDYRMTQNMPSAKPTVVEQIIEHHAIQVHLDM